MWRILCGDTMSDFDGKTYDPEEDFQRLKTSLDKVRHLMTNPPDLWWTLSGLAKMTGSSEAGISARIRDLRKTKNGGYQVESTRHSDGLWFYRVVGDRGQVSLFPTGKGVG